MNPRRIHDAMRERFPAFDPVEHEWVNVGEREGLNVERFSELLNRWISADEVLVEVHRRLGARLPKHEALLFIALHIGEGQIRIADRDFSSYVVLAVNGVATGWRQMAHHSIEAAASGTAQLKR